jgi:hypothetical protein
MLPPIIKARRIAMIENPYRILSKYLDPESNIAAWSLGDKAYASPEEALLDAQDEEHIGFRIVKLCDFKSADPS